MVIGVVRLNIISVETVDDQRCIYMKIWQEEVNVVNTQKLILKSKYTQKT